MGELSWKAGVLGLEAFYVWDSMVTWVVRAHDGVTELNPVIAGLHDINPLFYVSYRVGALLMLNVLLWQLYLEGPENFNRTWFRVLVGAGVMIYAIPLAMSLFLVL
jgi:hypothetical protein